MEEFPSRPTSMHRSTYARLEAMDDDMQSILYTDFGSRNFVVDATTQRWISMGTSRGSASSTRSATTFTITTMYGR